MRITLLSNPNIIHTQRWLSWLLGRGHTVSIVTDPGVDFTPPEGCQLLKPRWNLLTNILAYRLTYPRRYATSRWKHLHYRGLIRQTRPDLVLGMEALQNGYATAMAGPYPKVLMPWGKDVHHEADQHPFANRMVTRALHAADAITGTDPDLAEYLPRRFGVDPARIHAFTWGIDLGIFTPDLAGEAAQWRERLSVPPGAPVIFSPRNFHPYWGRELVLGAIPEVLVRHPDAVFVILRGRSSQSSEGDEARKLIEATGHGANVRMVDEVLAPRQIAELFSLATAFISVPRTDFMAQTILEGMACGCLPVVADRPTYKTHLRGGENALVLEEDTVPALARALDRALTDQALRTTAAEINIERMRQHEDWQRNALKIEEVFAMAIENFARANRV